MKIMEKTKIKKFLVVLVLATLVITLGLSAFAKPFAEPLNKPVIAQEVQQTQQHQQTQQQTQIEEQENPITQQEKTEPKQKQKYAIATTGSMYPWYLRTFSGTGFIIDNEEENAEPIRIVARKTGTFTITAPEEETRKAVLNQIQEKLGIEESAILPASASETESNKTKKQGAKVIKDKDVWSGTLTIGFGNLQKHYAIVGKEKDNSIEFAVISLHEYPVEINKLVIEKKIFPRLEIWKGTLELKSSDYKGEWQLTASSYRYSYPVPLEIAKGEQAKVSDYTIKPVEIKRKIKLFGFLPVGKEHAVVKVWKGKNLIGEKILSAGDTAQIGNLSLKVVKIKDRLQIIAETNEVTK